MCVYKNYCKETFDEQGKLKNFELTYPDNFNFGYDVVDEIASKFPEKERLFGAIQMAMKKYFRLRI